MYSILAKILSNIYTASHVYFEMIDQRVRNESSPRVIPSSFIYNVLHRSHSCVTWIAISIAGVHVSSSSTQMLFAEEASQITRHYSLSSSGTGLGKQTSPLSSPLPTRLGKLILVWPFVAPYACSSPRSNNRSVWLGVWLDRGIISRDLFERFNFICESRMELLRIDFCLIPEGGGGRKKKGKGKARKDRKW